MPELLDGIEDLAVGTSFSGVIRVDLRGEVALARAYGMANRANEIPNRIESQFAIASGSKGLTALTVVSLVEEGRLQLADTARSILAPDLPLLGEVTIEQLLSHRSGIGDYVDEDLGQVITEHVLETPVHRLATTEDYLPVLDGRPAKFPPGERFSYCNSGYVVLALVAERATGTSFHDLVQQRVCTPAGMASTSFLRSDELPRRAAVGYLAADGLRSNVLHLAVRGSGDGGIYSTAADIHALWTALFDGRIVSREWVEEMVRPRSTTASGQTRYGLGLWLHRRDAPVLLEGYDAGVSFRTVHDPGGAFTYTVLSNTSDGAWPVVRRLDEVLVDAR